MPGPGRPPKRRRYPNLFDSDYQPNRNKTIYLALLPATSNTQVNSVGPMNYKCVTCKALHFLGEKTQNHFKNCCHDGKVFLDEDRLLKPLPAILYEYYTLNTSDAVNFRDNIRQYNSAFAMASINSNLTSLPPGVFTYRVQGQVYTRIGPLHPSEGHKPVFSQLYIMENDIAINERMSNNKNNACKRDIMSSLQTVLNESNPFVQIYRMAGTILTEEEIQAFTEIRPKHSVSIQFLKEKSLDLRRYDSPTRNEVAIIFVGEEGEPPTNIDFAVQEQGQALTLLKSTSPNVDPLAFPLLFPNGELGWHERLHHRADKRTTRSRLTMLQFYQFRLAVRESFSPLFYAGKLFHEYCVLAYVRIESQRLNWLRMNQKQLRAEKYNNLMDSLYNEAAEAGKGIGKVIILPSTYVGSPQNMMQNYQDSMAIVCKYGKPDLFITFTCNPNWQEITDNLEGYQKKEHRPDLVARIFKLKLDELLYDITKRHIFGIPVAWFYTIEFQKRGLPHAHLLIILRDEDKPRTAESYDKFVCAEIPDQDQDPILFQTVSRNMIHGPCGVGYFTSPCMKDTDTGRKCSKNFPKTFCNETRDGTQNDGYVVMRRRDNGMSIKIKDFECDNRWVIPYNPYLCKKFNAHINVEICSTVKSVKYINKYIFKGHDRAKVQITVTSQDSRLQPSRHDQFIEHDEIKTHIDTRYVSAPEAVWRIFEYLMHKMSHTIVQLGVHLENQQTVTFTDGNEIEAASKSASTLLAFFKLNQTHESARQYLYTDIPSHFRYVDGKWQERKSHSAAEKVIARMYNYSFTDRERYYLRLLLLHVRGPTSFKDVRTYENITYDTFAATAKARGLLNDDQEWERCLKEANDFQLPLQLRQLFALICIFCDPSDPNALWGKFSAELIEDFKKNHSEITSKQMALHDISLTLSYHGKTLKDYGLPEPNMALIERNFSTEPFYNSDEESVKGHEKYVQLTCEQKCVVDTILNAVNNPKDKKLFYLDGPGGTGKTFVFTTILHILRSENKICLPVAFSGIAATLLDGGRTAHSRFKIPINSNKDSTSHMSIGSSAAIILKETHLIIWDEAPMTKSHDIVVVDRLLQDIMKNKEPFGGKVVLFAGDFRQLLPVVVNGSQNDIVEASIKRLSLWPKFYQLRLTQNMRARDDMEFADWVLKVGDGSANINEEDDIQLPLECIIHTPIEDYVFGLSININDHKSFTMKAILTPKNEDCFEINKRIVDKIPGVVKIYESCDTVIEDDPTDALNYPVEYLNSITPAGMPPHILKLKVGCIIMLLRNLNATQGLCNGTRLIIRSLATRVIDAEIICGDHVGDRVFIPRIRLQPSNSQLPFKFCRLQFPIRLAFAMTINKSQGQTFDKIGILLPNPVFAHGQLYVAFSRVRRYQDVKVQIMNTEKQGARDNLFYTKNVVYREIFE